MSKRSHSSSRVPSTPTTHQTRSSSPTFSFANLIHKLLIWSFYLLVIAVPLFFLTVNEELFEFNKMLLTYGFTVVITTLWLAKSIIQKQFIFKRTPFDIPLLIFVVSQVISTLLSIHPRTSFFGYYTRFHGGLLSTLTYILLYYAYVQNFSVKEQRGMLRSLLIGAVLVSLYAIPEHFGHSLSCVAIYGKYDVACWVQDVQTRVFATFGQPNWLAAYAVMIIPIALAMFIEQTKQKVLSVWDRVDLWLSGSAAVLLFTTLLFTRSRSGVLAIVAGLGMFAISAVILKLSRAKDSSVPAFSLKKLAIIAIFFVGIASFFGTPFSPSAQEITQKLSNQPTQSEPETPAEPQPVTNRLETGGTDSGEIRKIVWEGAVNVWKRNPLFGSGVETFAYSYYTDRPMTHNHVSEWDFLYNKAHNEFLNFLATTGLLGLGAYLLWQLWVAVYLTKHTFFKDHSSQTKLLLIGVGAAIIGLHVSNFFGFSTVTVSILLFLFPAFAIVSQQNQTELEEKNISATELTAGQYISLAGLGLIGIYFLLLIYMMWQTDYLYARAKQYFQEGDVQTAYQTLHRAMKMSPNEGILYELQSKVASQLAIALVENKQTEVATQVATEAMELSDTSIKLNPYHLNFYKSRVQVLLTIAQAQPDLLQAAIATLDVAQILAPTDPKLEYNEGVIYSSMNDLEKAEEHLKKAVEMKPDYEAARYQLGQIYERQQKYNLAQEHYQFILEHIAPNNSLAKQRLEVVATFSAQQK